VNTRHEQAVFAVDGCLFHFLTLPDFNSECHLSRRDCKLKNQDDWEPKEVLIYSHSSQKELRIGSHSTPILNQLFVAQGIQGHVCFAQCWLLDSNLTSQVRIPFLLMTDAYSTF